MNHRPSSAPHRVRHAWPMLALLCATALCACGSSTTPASADQDEAAGLHCAPASARPEAVATVAAASCAAPARRPS